MNDEKLAVITLGHRNSGKSVTWNNLFGHTVRTGTNARRLRVKGNLYVEVFLVSGSPEERETYVGKIIVDINIRIILCSVQYKKDCISTIDFFRENGYGLYVHWLNPGYYDETEYEDTDGIIETLDKYDAIVEKHDGKKDPSKRTTIMRKYIYDWANVQGLVKKDA